MFIVKSDFYYALGGFEVKKIIEFFSGKKSYVSLIAMLASIGAYSLGFISADQMIAAIVATGGAVGISFRLAIAKSIVAGEKAIDALKEIEKKLPQ